MNDIPFDAVGFDLDGTFLDTFRDLGAAVNYALAHGGFDHVSIESSKDLIGGGAKIMLARAVEAQGGMPENEFRALYKVMLRYYSEHNAVYSKPYPHALEVLDTLDAAGIKSVIVTNKFEEFARNILTQLGIIDRFVTVIGGNSLGKGTDGAFIAKPAPEPILAAKEACLADGFVFVGDSSYDVRAAKAAGVPVVVAGYGYCDKPPHELDGDVVIDSLSGLIPALQGL